MSCSQGGISARDEELGWIGIAVETFAPMLRSTQSLTTEKGQSRCELIHDDNVDRSRSAKLPSRTSWQKGRLQVEETKEAETQNENWATLTIIQVAWLPASCSHESLPIVRLQRAACLLNSLPHKR